MDGLGLSQMTTKPETKSETAPATMAAVDALKDMPTEEIKGIYTALSVVEPRLKALSEAVKSGKDTEAALEKYRKDMATQRAASPMYDAMLKSHPELIADEEKKIADGSRKAVTAEIETLNTQMNAIQSHLIAVRAKFGTPAVTVKTAGTRQQNPGTLNIQNATLAKAELESRGYSNIEIVELPGFPGYHELRAVSPDGGFRKGRYYAQILKDW
jgi:hypothetical protein